MTLVWSVTAIVVGASVLLLGVEWIYRASEVLSRRRGLPVFAFGMTIGALVTSAPELTINAMHAIRGGEAIVVGNVLGSNMFNVLMILGLAAYKGRVAVSAAALHQTMPIFGMGTLALYPLLWDGTSSRGDGIILALAAIAYVIFILQSLPSDATTPGNEGEQEVGRYASRAQVLALFVFGTMAVFGGARIVVAGGELLDASVGGLALSLSENPTLYGISILAVCTSLPEMALGMGAFARRDEQLLAGVVLGSCAFNIFFGFGTVSVLVPVGAPLAILNSALVLNLIAIAGCLGLLLLQHRLSRVAGILCVATYVVFVLWMVLSALGQDLARIAFWVTAVGCALPLPMLLVQWMFSRFHPVAT